MIGVVPADLGMTNTDAGQDGERIVGFNTEDTEVNEGFSVYIPFGFVLTWKRTV